MSSGFAFLKKSYLKATTFLIVPAVATKSFLSLSFNSGTVPSASHNFRSQSITIAVELLTVFLYCFVEITRQTMELPVTAYIFVYFFSLLAPRFQPHPALTNRGESRLRCLNTTIQSGLLDRLFGHTSSSILSPPREVNHRRPESALPLLLYRPNELCNASTNCLLHAKLNATLHTMRSLPKRMCNFNLPIGEEHSNIVHFIRLYSTRASAQLTFLHFMAVLSAERQLQPIALFFHSNYEPHGVLWLALLDACQCLQWRPTKRTGMILGIPTLFVTHEIDYLQVSEVRVYFLRDAPQGPGRKCP